VADPRRRAPCPQARQGISFPPRSSTAKAYLREDNLRKASSVLEQVWKLNPHPEIAKA